MGQPFLLGDRYISNQQDIEIFLKEDHLLLESRSSLQVVSSALWGGGFNMAVRRFVNWKVPFDYACKDPVELMGRKLHEWGYGNRNVIGLQTAANIHQTSIVEESGDCFQLLCCTTAGISNAARAGRSRKTYSAYSCGTINTFILVNGCMSPAAMVNAIVTATEAKAVALQDLEICDENGAIASGTTTDSVVVGVTQQGFEEVHQFAGVATTIGNAIGRVVYQSVVEAIGGPKPIFDEDRVELS